MIQQHVPLPMSHNDIVSALCDDRYYHSGTHANLDEIADAIRQWIREAQQGGTVNE